MSLTQSELVDMVFVLEKCNKNAFLASTVYAQQYPDRSIDILLLECYTDRMRRKILPTIEHLIPLSW